MASPEQEKKQSLWAALVREVLQPRQPGPVDRGLHRSLTSGTARVFLAVLNAHDWSKAS